MGKVFDARTMSYRDDGSKAMPAAESGEQAPTLEPGEEYGLQGAGLVEKVKTAAKRPRRRRSRKKADV